MASDAWRVLGGSLVVQWTLSNFYCLRKSRKTPTNITVAEGGDFGSLSVL